MIFDMDVKAVLMIICITIIIMALLYGIVRLDDTNNFKCDDKRSNKK